MKNKAKIKKSIIAMSTIVSLGTGFAITSPNIASAAEIETRSQQGAIQDVYANIDNMLASISTSIAGSKGWTRTSEIYGNSMNVTGVNIEETNITNVKPIYLGSNTFVNNTGIDQTYGTSEFSQAITTTTTTTTQNGFSSSTMVGGKVKIPFIAEGEVQETLEYNFSKTNENLKSETNTLTAPSQSVNVPANKIYKTEVYFEKKQTSGKVELYADVLTGAKKPLTNKVFSVGSALDKADQKYDLIKSPHDPDQVRLLGNGTFTVEYGTNLIVKTYDITSTGKSSESTNLVNTQIIPLT
ncbi:hypothetical protein BTXL6_11105 [Bacillus thuringiensis]|nr:hypothetical protein BTXL6_28670 [Bacillus thuringiensis]ALL21961.1 hypothetical protein BTXL6_11105 [Bacillus thuringiensis]EEM19381.1 hypothetical protein bthur0001_55080 [Bacillus thuringiensis serovar tochigiensis BGSC 4Y1]